MWKSCFIVKVYLQIFNGNFDKNTPVTNYLPTPVTASYIRLYQEEVNQDHGAIRMEILGCQSVEEDTYSGKLNTSAIYRCGCSYWQYVTAIKRLSAATVTGNRGLLAGTITAIRILLVVT